MAEVRFFGTSDADIFELKRVGSEGDRIILKATFKWRWLPRACKQFAVTRAELEALAKWLDDFWNEAPPAELAGGIVRFVYSHREHIGEGYFHIELKGRRVLTAYEQLGTSNTFRAERIRDLMR